MISELEKKRISVLSQELHSIIRKVSVLRYLRWDSQIKDDFFKHKARELPKVSYAKFDGSAMLEKLKALELQVKDSIFDDWIRRHIHVAKTTINMLSSVGTVDFNRYSVALYGEPQQCLHDDENTSLALAEKFHERLAGRYIPTVTRQYVSSQEAMKTIKLRVEHIFNEDSPAVILSDKLSSNASASVKRIKLRKSAQFTERDIEQLIQHEASIHVATALNGRAQRLLPTLGSSHAGTTKTQEGIAVFAELITGTMDINRMRRLSDRMIAINMSMEGADFIEVYQYFLEQTQGNEDQSFENTQRVFRGGVLAGGAPFTKDIVYLDGLVRVHNFLRVAVAADRADCIPLLFCGKLDLNDLSVISEMFYEGLCLKPKYLPTWVTDMDFLFSYMAYSSFLNQIDLPRVSEHYSEVLKNMPKITM